MHSAPFKCGFVQPKVDRGSIFCKYNGSEHALCICNQQPRFPAHSAMLSAMLLWRLQTPLLRSQPVKNWKDHAVIWKHSLTYSSALNMTWSKSLCGHVYSCKQRRGNSAFVILNAVCISYTCTKVGLVAYGRLCRCCCSDHFHVKRQSAGCSEITWFKVKERRDIKIHEKVCLNKTKDF